MPCRWAQLRLGLLLADLGFLGERLAPAFETLQIGEHELGLHRLGVAGGIDGPFHMGDVAVLEAAQHMGDGVDGANVAQELIA